MGSVAFAQTPADSLKEYDLGEVVVGGGRDAATSSPSTIQKIPLAAIDRIDAASVAEVARLIPAAHVQTNSRGETLVYLRAAGERQVALFFDGALLNVPWDNRVDLALVPSSVVGGVTVAKGVPSVLWGANVLGGAVNMVSRGLEGEGSFTEAGMLVGQADFKATDFDFGYLHATHLGKRGPWSYVGSVGYADRDGVALPNDLDDAGLHFSQSPEGRLRTNTFSEGVHGFGRVAYAFGDRASLGVSVLHVDGEKGVAPEGHLDPAVDRVRFWRYPEWRMTMAVLSGEAELGAATSLRGAVWGSRFGQEIASFTDASYIERDGTQRDDDATAGSRLVLQHVFAPVTLRLGLNALTSTHRQQETAFEADQATQDPELTFRQGLYSVGLEGETTPADRLTLTGGVSFDALTTPETGDKPARDAFTDYGLTAGAVYRLNPTWTLNAAAGRKTRFPTLRELFGEALNRFAVNPDLRPESSLLAEVGLRHAGGVLSGEVTAFLNNTVDTIDQQRLEDGRRRRINLGSSRVVGVELTGALRPVPRVRFDGHLTVMSVQGFDGNDEEIKLSEKPEAIGRLAATYNSARSNATLEAVYTGIAYSPTDDGFARLDPALVLNARIGSRAELWGTTGEVVFRIDNITDAVVLPQLGLPGPGREFKTVVKISF